MILITLDPKSPTPEQRQILDRVRGLIEEGALRPGDRLPSTRRLAGMLEIHRSTVATA
jgi:DNA-binding transcriptional regulator YhcF (GntR family)